MNPQFDPEQNRMWHELTDEERRKQEIKQQEAIEKLEGMEHHIPPRKGEHCYFMTVPQQADMIRTARYYCQTNHGGVGVDFSVETPVDTYYTKYHYQGTLETILHDHGKEMMRRVHLR